MPMNRTKYPADWPAISLRIRVRDRHRCVTCGLKHNELVYRTSNGLLFIRSNGRAYWARTGKPVQASRAAQGSRDKRTRNHPDPWYRGSEMPPGRMIRVICTVAHLRDKNPMACSDDNLATMCQLHHLELDHADHMAAGRRTRRRRLADRDLFEDVLPEVLARHDATV